MSPKIKIVTEDTNTEILARIVKAASRKYDCTMKIDFHNGNRLTRFVGDESLMPHIAEEVHNIFSEK